MKKFLLLTALSLGASSSFGSTVNVPTADLLGLDENPISLGSAEPVTKPVLVSVDKSVIKKSFQYIDENTQDFTKLQKLLENLQKEFNELSFKTKGFGQTPTPAQTNLKRWLSKNTKSVQIHISNSRNLLKEVKKSLSVVGKLVETIGGKRSVKSGKEIFFQQKLDLLISDSSSLKSQIQAVTQALASLEAANKGAAAVKTTLSDRDMLQDLNTDMDAALLALVKAANVGDITIKRYVEGQAEPVEETLKAENIADVLGKPINITIPKALTPQKEKALRENLRTLSKVLKAINAKLRHTLPPVVATVPASSFMLASEAVLNPVATTKNAS